MFIARTQLDHPGAYGVYASQLIRYARCYSNYSDFFLMPQGPGSKTLVTGLQSLSF